MLDHDIVGWNRATQCSGPVLFDRGIAGSIGYLTLEGLPVPDYMPRAARTFSYAPAVLIAPFWPEICENDKERRQDPELARRTCAAVAQAWRECAYQTIDLPLVSVAEHAEFVLEQVQKAIVR